MLNAWTIHWRESGFVVIVVHVFGWDYLKRKTYILCAEVGDSEGWVLRGDSEGWLLGGDSEGWVLGGDSEGWVSGGDSEGWV